MRQLTGGNALFHSWLLWGLAGSDRIEVVDSSVPAIAGSVARGRPTGRRTAGTVPADLLVSGNYYHVGTDIVGGTKIVLNTTITDLASGTVVFAASPMVVDTRNPAAALTRLREQLMGGISVRR